VKKVAKKSAKKVVAKKPAKKVVPKKAVKTRKIDGKKVPMRVGSMALPKKLAGKPKTLKYAFYYSDSH
jgi:hypothetical protein